MDEKIVMLGSRQRAKPKGSQAYDKYNISLIVFTDSA